MKVNELRAINGTDLYVTALGLGSAPLGGLYSPVSTQDATALLSSAWAAGIRYFDTAPMYGNGRSEHLVGNMLLECASTRADYVLSSKVGRLMVTARPGRVIGDVAPKNPLDPGWYNALPFTEEFDYSYDGVMRSFDDSQQRTGLDRIDMLYVHDIGRLTHGDRHDHYWHSLTKGGGFRALTELRDAELIAAFGLGVNECEVISAALNEADLNCCLLAGRYTLLDQSAVTLGLMDQAKARNVSLVIGGVFNSGVLAARPGDRQMYNYAEAPPAIVEKVQKLRNLSEKMNVPLTALALQYPLRHPAVTSVVIGAKTPSQLHENIDMFELEIREEVWRELRSDGLIHID